MFASFLAAVLSGLLLVAAFPRYDQGYLLFFALIPLFWALRGQSRQAAFWLGIVNGVTFFLGLLSWIFYVTYVYGHLPLPVALGVLLLLAAYLSIYRGLWAWGVVWAEERGHQPPVVCPGPVGGDGVRPGLPHQQLPLGTHGGWPLSAVLSPPGRRPHRHLRAVLSPGPGQYRRWC